MIFSEKTRGKKSLSVYLKDKIKAHLLDFSELASIRGIVKHDEIIENIRYLKGSRRDVYMSFPFRNVLEVSASTFFKNIGFFCSFEQSDLK